MEAFVCDAVCTPIGRYGGNLSTVRADDLAAVPLKALFERNPAADWSRLDDVVYGCANQAGEDNRNVARMAALLAGMPVDVPGVMINRLCGSGLDALGTAVRVIRAGDADFMIASGVESMSRARFVMPKAATAFSQTNAIYDTTIGWRFVNPKMQATYDTHSMPETADNVAADYGISRAPGCLRSPPLVLLRHKYQSLLGLFHPLAQHGQRGRVRANWTVMARLTVAIGLVT